MIRQREERAPIDERSHALRNGLLCAFVVVAAVLAAHPSAEIGIGDDWSYARTALAFAQTGHFVYNGWSSPMLGWQVLWGALFMKLLGFSFHAVRLSTLPVAAAAIVLFYLTLARFGVHARNAAIGVLTLGLSPLFVPLAASYMTDVPGLFCIVLCIYLCQRAVAAVGSKAAIGWLAFAAASNVAGGTARQIVWLGALLMVPSTAWLLRRRRGVLPAAALLWAASVAGMVACMRWFVRQPNSLVLRGADDPSHLMLHLAFQLMGAFLCLLLLVYPILAAWLPDWRKLRRNALARIAIVSLLCGFFQWEIKWLMPWLTDVISTLFAPSAGPAFGARPVVSALPAWARVGISLLMIASLLVLIESALRGPGARAESRGKPRIGNKAGADWREVFWLLGPFAAGYVLLLLLAAYHLVIFDRYLLGLMPAAIVVLLLSRQQWFNAKLPAVSVLALAVYAFLAIAGTHDLFAAYRARAAAIAEIRASGVPRTQIQGGIEYDAWTQIAADGNINGQMLVDMDRAHRDPHGAPGTDKCKLSYELLTPAVQPRYSVVFGVGAPCVLPSQLPPVVYNTWLPPFDRAVHVQRIRAAGMDSP